MNSIRVSNRLDPDLARHFGSKMFANVISRGKKSRCSRKVSCLAADDFKKQTFEWCTSAVNVM